MSVRRASALIALALPFAVLACGEPSADYSGIPRGFPVPDPPASMGDMEMSENYAVEIEDRLFELGRDMVQGTLGTVADLLTDDFHGDSLAGLEVREERLLLHAATLVEFDPTSARKVDGAGFVAGIDAMFRAWRRLDFVRWDVLAAEFQPGQPTWGKARIRLFVIGRDPEDRVHSVTVVFDAQVLNDRGRWLLRAVELQSQLGCFRQQPLFTDISGEAGVGYVGVPSGRAGGFARELRRQPFNGASGGDANGDGVWDFFVSGKERNFLYLGRGDGTFDERAEEWGLLLPANGAGAVFFDFDNDRDQDLVVVGEGWLAADGTRKGAPLRIYRNEDGGFTEVARELGLDVLMYSQSVIVLDHDNDGWLDIFVSNYGRRATGNNSWTDSDNGDSCALFRNRGGTRFEDVSDEAGISDSRWSYAAAAADFDRDGDQDIYVAHDFSRNTLYENQGDGTFRDVGPQLAAEDLGFGMGVDWADLDNDGRLDLYIANMSTPAAGRIFERLNPQAAGVGVARKLARGNTILLQQEDGSFRAAPEELGGIDGLWAWGCAIHDFDLDGRLDVYCANGMFTRSGVGELQSWFFRNVAASEVDVAMAPGIGTAEEPNDEAFRQARVTMGSAGRSWGGHERDKLWFNRGAEGFLDLSDVSGVDSPGDGRAAVAADIDDDGDLDLFLNEFSYSTMNRQLLMRNDIQERPTGFLKIRLRASTGQYQAVGAEVIVETPLGPCSQVLSFGAGFVSSNPPELVFGLGDAGSARVEVIWPGAVRESFGEIAANSRVLLVEGAGVGSNRDDQ